MKKASNEAHKTECRDSYRWMCLMLKVCVRGARAFVRLLYVLLLSDGDIDMDINVV